MNLSTLWHNFFSILLWIHTFFINIRFTSIENLQPEEENTIEKENYHNFLKIPQFLPLNPSIDMIEEKNGGSIAGNFAKSCRNSARKLFSFDDYSLMTNPKKPRNSIASILSLDVLIGILQYLNKRLVFETNFQKDARRGKRSRMTWRDWIAHSWDTKRRRDWVQRIMNQTIHKRLYYDFLQSEASRHESGEEHLNNAENFLEDLHESDGHSSRKTYENSPFKKSQHTTDGWHPVQDFDRIQFEYLKSIEQLHLSKQTFEFSTFDTDPKKFETIDHLVRAYIYGPLIKDNYYRTLNGEIFQWGSIPKTEYHSLAPR